MRTRIIRRSNLVYAMIKPMPYGSDHFSLKKIVNKVIGASPEYKALTKSEGVPDSVKAKAEVVKNDTVNKANQGLIKGLALGASVVGGGLISNALSKAADKKALAADQQSALNASNISLTNANPDAPLGKALGVSAPVVSSIADGEPVKADIVTTAVKPATKIEGVVKAVDKAANSQLGQAVIKAGKGVIKSTTNPTPAADVKLQTKGSTFSDPPNVANAGTPMPGTSNAVIYIALGAVVLVVLFSKLKS